MLLPTANVDYSSAKPATQCVQKPYTQPLNINAFIHREECTKHVSFVLISTWKRMIRRTTSHINPKPLAKLKDTLP